LTDLIRELLAVPGLARIRLSSIEPTEVTDELLALMAGEPRLCRHLHMPLQSGSDAVLARMNRPYTAADYLAVVERARSAVPLIGLTTDVMVGFPGEKEEHFKNTLKLMEEVEFDQAFMFAYSPRPNTPAASMPEQVPRNEKLRRLQELISLQNEIQQRKNEREVGNIVEVLVEGRSEKNERKLSGRTRTNKIVVFEGDEKLCGNFVIIKLNKAYLWGFEGELISAQA